MTDLVDHFKRRSTPAIDADAIPIGTIILMGSYVGSLDAYARVCAKDKVFTWEYRNGLYTDNDLDEKMSKARYVYVVAPEDIQSVKGAYVNSKSAGITK